VTAKGSGDAAQCDFHGDVVSADDEEHAQGGVVACLVAQVVVDELDVEVELADVFVLEPAVPSPPGPRRR